jgi:CelD/BcsL family acetyltransferase involved in cellulose biosynthesis
LKLAYHELPAAPPDWDDRIRRYRTKTLFHESAWLAHLLDIHPDGRIRYFEVHGDAGVVGLACALEVRRFGLRVWGSPLPGTGTNYLGPALDDASLMEEAVRAFVECGRARRVAHIELANPALDGADLSALGFTAQPGLTHLVPLPDNAEEAWAGLKSACRNRVRKGQQNELRPEITDDPAIADEFFEQFIEVYGKQGMAVPFRVERPRSLFRRLAPAGRVLALRIWAGDHIAATGLFPYDERCIYFWGAASWLADQHLCPNELLHWTVMEAAVERGIPLYNMCGGASRFKDKFGGSDQPYTMHTRSAHRILDLGRDALRRWHWMKLKLRGPAKQGTA